MNGRRLVVVAGMVVTTVFALQWSSPSSDGFIFVFAWLLTAVVVSFPALVLTAVAGVAIVLLAGLALVSALKSARR